MPDKKMLSIIPKLQLNECTFHDETIQPTLINFFFGKNGCGKSTIARHIQSLSKTSSDVANYEIMLYDQKFIDANIGEDNKLPGVFTLSETNINIQKEIDALNKEEAELFDRNWDLLQHPPISPANNKKEIADSCWKACSFCREHFPNTLTGTRNNTIKFFDKLLETTPEHCDINLLESQYDIAFGENATVYPDLREIPPIKVEDYLGFDLLSQQIISSSDTPFASFIQAIGATDWVKHGHDAFSKNSNGYCPYCHQKLPDDFEQQIVSCFNEIYIESITKLISLQKKYIENTEELINCLTSNCNNSFQSIDFTLYKEKSDKLEKLIRLNQRYISDKLKTPSTPIQLEDLSLIISELNELAEKINSAIHKNNEIVNAKKEAQSNIKNMVWRHMASITKEKIDKYNKEVAEFDNLLNQFNEERASIAKVEEEIKKQKSILNSQFSNVDSAMDSINKELINSGFQGFHLGKDESKPFRYKIIRDDGSPARQLSEGERNFIAFLYFYNKVKGRDKIDSDFKDRIIVIDDPVSSMDSSAIFAISSIIRELTSICYNNGDASAANKPRYIKQMFILTHNAFFFKEVSYNLIKQFHCVNFYHIQKSRNVSKIKLCIHKDINSEAPAVEKNYSPIKDAYSTLWKEYKEVTSSPVLIKTAREILEYYFIQLSGHEGQSLANRIREKYSERDSTIIQNTESLHTVNSLLRYIGNYGIRTNDGFDYIEDTDDTDKIRNAFELIFKIMEQDQHYKLMMETT